MNANSEPLACKLSTLDGWFEDENLQTLNLTECLLSEYTQIYLHYPIKKGSKNKNGIPDNLKVLDSIIPALIVHNHQNTWFYPYSLYNSILKLTTKSFLQPIPNLVKTCPNPRAN